MASLKTSILEAALEDGLIPKRLTSNQVEYLHPTAITANDIYWAIADAEQGLDYEQLGKRTALAHNTIKQFCRWMVTSDLLYTETYNGRLVLFTRKRRAIA